MHPERRKLYDKLRVSIGNTPLKKFDGCVPNGNQIWLKCECDNPYGSHYDRVFLQLFENFEDSGRITPGAEIYETTSGSAGISFAAISKELGYIAHVGIPAGGEQARILAIESYGASIHYTPAETYLAGFPEFILKFKKANPKCIFLNHSMSKHGGANNSTISALEKIGTEIERDLPRIDYFIPAVGNGSSILGPARGFTRGLKIIAFETFQSAVAYEQLYPDRYQERFGISPGTLNRHRLPGTSFPGIDFPHIKLSVEERIINEVVLVSDFRMDQEYRSLTGRDDSLAMPHWDTIEVDGFGRTTHAGLAVALSLSETVSSKNFVVIAYDRADRYDN